MSGQEQNLQHFADNFIPVVPVDAKEHTDAKPFCWNGGCLCHEDEGAIAQVHQYVQDGLLTSGEATDYVNGKTL